MYLLEEAGFTNIETIPMLDLQSEKEEGLENTIQEIEIGGQAEFKKCKRFDFTTTILISYHSYAERNMIITSEEAKGESYDEIIERISKAGFFNVQDEVIRDTDNDNTHDNEVEGITIGASDRYSLEDSFPLNTEILVYHSFIEQKMPITSEKAKGMIAKLSKGKKITVKGKITLTSDLGYFMNIHEIIY